ncbi:MAG: potassium-transporting ATPase subunit KdpA [Coriobacteriales bacterium]|jgi:K+-transporting ATPase ATPase A chain|nr:potassium-transporting ATPase subunit KdpA [Coriobacteriales bacterium]
MSLVILQDIFFISLLILAAIPLGLYIHKIMIGQKVFLTPVLAPVERIVYKICGVKANEEMRPKRYLLAILAFSLVGLIVLFLIQLLQGWLPLNPQQFSGVRWDLALNTSASYVSNTNWQAYAGETTLSYLTQALGMTVQNFVSAATGIAVLFVLIRGFIQREKETIGNFWVDLTRVTLYVLIPLSIVIALVLVSQGVVQTFLPNHIASSLAGGLSQVTPLGPAASQIAIKQLGTNGGGFFGTNSAFPLENPNTFSNFIETFSLLIIPSALCFTFGKAVKDHKQGRSIITVMLILFIVGLTVITISEQYLAPQFAGVVVSGNMEGKEVINGIGASALWGASTTAASNGAVNATPDSFTAFGGMTMLVLMQLGEIVFGGVGSGLYAMLGFVMLTVFIAGLMVGRTPEYLSKKIEPYDMRMVCLIIFTPPLVALLSTAVAVLMPGAAGWLTNSGAHGFSEILYGYTSMANNNGSAFAGLQANTVFTNLVGGAVMLLVRFLPISATILLAGNMSRKKSVAVSEGTLSTTNGIFVGLLIAIILIVGALAFLPALALGPIASFFTN